MADYTPGRDKRAVRFPAKPGARRPATPKSVIVVGGGIAGLAAATGLAERGVQVTLVEPKAELGGRVRAWKVDSAAGQVSMSRGFHAFFRQYYNLRALLGRAGKIDDLLHPVEDYPVVSVNGDRDSFMKIPRTPPWSFASFVLKSPTFTARDLVRVDLDAALSLLDVSFPETYRAFDGESAADFLDRLRFPDRARHLALEVFARSFFADPREFSAGELVAMFHTYFLGSAEGLLFDVPRDDFDTTLWAPLGRNLESLGVQLVQGEVERVETAAGDRRAVVLAGGQQLEADAVVLAADPGNTKQIVAASPDLSDTDWRARVEGLQLAPAFAVWRFWTDRKVDPDRPAFLGTARFGPLDNISVLERFEQGAADWSAEHGGSVIELHAYSLPRDSDPEALKVQLRAELEKVYPETRTMEFRAEQFLIERDCGLIGTGPWDARPEVRTPDAQVKLAGDWVRCDWPIALMERAATTGWMAANELLENWGLEGHDLWSVPVSARQSWPARARKLLRRRTKAASVTPE